MKNATGLRFFEEVDPHGGLDPQQIALNDVFAAHRRRP
jgi:hypothetical protein